MTTKQVGFWVSIIMAVLAVAAQGSIHLPVGVPESWGAIIQSWSAFIMAIYLIVNPFLPSDVVGPKINPLAPPDPKEAKVMSSPISPTIKILFFAVVLIGAFGVFDRAHAQATTTTQTSAWTISLPANIQATIVADLQAAAADAAAQTPPDVRHGPCWTALATFAQNGFNNPLPNKPGVFLLVQKGFDFQGQSGTPLIPTALAQACGPTILDLKVTFAQFLAKAGFAVSPIKIPLF